MLFTRERLSDRRLSLLSRLHHSVVIIMHTHHRHVVLHAHRHPLSSFHNMHADLRTTSCKCGTVCCSIPIHDSVKFFLSISLPTNRYTDAPSTDTRAQPGDEFYDAENSEVQDGKNGNAVSDDTLSQFDFMAMFQSMMKELSVSVDDAAYERYSHITVHNAEVMVFDSDDSIPGVGMTYSAVSGVEIGMPRHIETKKMSVAPAENNFGKTLKADPLIFPIPVCTEPTGTQPFRNAPTETDTRLACDPTQRGQNDAVMAQYRRDKWAATTANRNYVGVWPMFRRHGPMGLSEGVCKCQWAPKPWGNDDDGKGVKAGDMVETPDETHNRWSPQPRYQGKVFSPFNRLLQFASMARLPSSSTRCNGNGCAQFCQTDEQCQSFHLLSELHRKRRDEGAATRRDDDKITIVTQDILPDATKPERKRGNEGRLLKLTFELLPVSIGAAGKQRIDNQGFRRFDYERLLPKEAKELLWKLWGDTADLGVGAADKTPAGDRLARAYALGENPDGDKKLTKADLTSYLVVTDFMVHRPAKSKDKIKPRDENETFRYVLRQTKAPEPENFPIASAGFQRMYEHVKEPIRKAKHSWSFPSGDASDVSPPLGAGANQNWGYGAPFFDAPKKEPIIPGENENFKSGAYVHSVQWIRAPSGVDTRPEGFLNIPTGNNGIHGLDGAPGQNAGNIVLEVRSLHGDGRVYLNDEKWWESFGKEGGEWSAPTIVGGSRFSGEAGQTVNKIRDYVKQLEKHAGPRHEWARLLSVENDGGRGVGGQIGGPGDNATKGVKHAGDGTVFLDRYWRKTPDPNVWTSGILTALMGAGSIFRSAAIMYVYFSFPTRGPFGSDFCVSVAKGTFGGRGGRPGLPGTAGIGGFAGTPGEFRITLQPPPGSGAEKTEVKSVGSFGALVNVQRLVTKSDGGETMGVRFVQPMVLNAQSDTTNDPRRGYTPANPIFMGYGGGDSPNRDAFDGIRISAAGKTYSTQREIAGDLANEETDKDSKTEMEAYKAENLEFDFTENGFTDERKDKMWFSYGHGRAQKIATEYIVAYFVFMFVMTWLPPNLGGYNTAINLVTGICNIPPSLGTSMFPFLSSLIAGAVSSAVQSLAAWGLQHLYMSNCNWYPRPNPGSSQDIHDYNVKEFDGDRGFLAQKSKQPVAMDLSQTRNMTPAQRSHYKLGPDPDSDNIDSSELVAHKDSADEQPRDYLLSGSWVDKTSIGSGAYKDHVIAFWSNRTTGDNIGAKIFGLRHGRAPKAQPRPFPDEKSLSNPTREHPRVNIRADERRDHQQDTKDTHAPTDVDDQALQASKRENEADNALEEVLADEIEEVDFALDQVKGLSESLQQATADIAAVQAQINRAEEQSEQNRREERNLFEQVQAVQTIQRQMDQFRAHQDQVDDTVDAIVARNKLASQCLQLTAEKEVMAEEQVEAATALEESMDRREVEAFRAVEESKFEFGAQNAVGRRNRG